MHSLTSLFLAQSYKDTWDDYKRSLTSSNFACWDYVILTASNEHQAAGFLNQIEKRKNGGFLPQKTHFAIIPDEGGKRVGSGGATLGVIKYIAEREGKADFSGLRILVIHSGGDSKRVPQYSALGKLFSPVPHKLPDGRPSTLFDELMIAMTSVPGRMQEGMLLLSGDVLLLFNPLLIDYPGKGAAAISFKEKVETGKNHGVYLMGADGNVQRFLHKQTTEKLKENGAVNDSGDVDIDTGAVIFSGDMISSLYRLISENGVFSNEKYRALVNDRVRLSLYGDFLYPLAADSTLEKFYNEAPEGQMCDELTGARKLVWDALRPYRMKLIRLAPAKFIHFGTTREIMGLMNGGVKLYENLDWSDKVCSSIKGNAAGYNSVLSGKAQMGENCYLEVSYVHSDAKIGNNVLLSYIEVYDETIPDGVVVHGLKQKNGKFVVRIFGVDDNPKENKLFGRPITELLAQNKMTEEDIWDDDGRTLWSARLYPECDTIKEALAEALNLYDISNGGGNLEMWKNSNRASLCSGFNAADPDALIAWDNRMQELVRMDGISKLISANKPAGCAKEILNAEKLTPIQKDWLDRQLEKADFGMAIRLNFYTGKALSGVESDKYLSECFKTISRTILKSTLDNLKYNDKCKIATDRHVVELPLRINWGGGWSDTPPYCIENGGTVLNAAILLDGKRPVQVTLEKIPEPKIVFDSRDMDVHGEFEEIEPLQRTGDPFDPFALQKSCLLACGILPKEGGNLKEILTRLGGGFVMNSEVTNVPKGSGLGTSSILSAACVKAVFEFMGIEYTQDDLYAHVLCMEQIMSTGGGWQDQVGGVTEGVKYITSKPGMNQKLKVEHINVSQDTKDELGERLALIYTGQRRLARNLLRDVVGRYVGGEPDSLYALNEIQKIATLMRFELERGNVDEFAKLMNQHWELSKKIDAGSTNTLIDQIFASVDEFTDGKLICGAGGGGFLQVILKKNVKKDTVHKKLKEVFGDSDIGVWDCTLV